MAPPRIAVMHHPRSFFPLDLYEQVRGAADLIWVLSGQNEDEATDPRLLRRLGTVVDIAGMCVDEAADTLKAHRPEGIVSFVEEHIEDAAALANRLGLRYHTPQVALSVVDKRVQRTLAAEAGIPGPSFRVVSEGTPIEEIGRLAAEVGFPVVIKPARGSGSRGIESVDSYEELVSLLSLDESAVGSFVGVIEEFLLDDPDRNPTFASYVSVESVVSHGRVSHVAVTGRFPLASSFRETGNFIPAAEDTSTLFAVTTMAGHAIEALGIFDSIVHTEIKLTPEGPKLIEVNGRLGGRPPFVLQEVSSVNLFQVACAVAAGRPVCFRRLVECDGVGFWLMFQPPPSARRVTSIDGLSTVNELSEVKSACVTRSVGAAVDAREGTDAKVLTVRGRTKDLAGLAKTVASIETAVSIRYD
jgi:biotin carboxylase